MQVQILSYDYQRVLAPVNLLTSEIYLYIDEEAPDYSDKRFILRPDLLRLLLQYCPNNDARTGEALNAVLSAVVKRFQIQRFQVRVSRPQQKKKYEVNAFYLSDLEVLLRELKNHSPTYRFSAQQVLCQLQESFRESSCV